MTAGGRRPGFTGILLCACVTLDEVLNIGSLIGDITLSPIS